MYSHLQREFTELQRSHQLLQTRLQQVPATMVLRMLVLLMIMSPAEGAMDDGFDDDCDCEEDDDSMLLQSRL